MNDLVLEVRLLYCSLYAVSFETDESLPRREKILAKAANVPPTPCLKKGQTTVEANLFSFMKHTIPISKNYFLLQENVLLNVSVNHCIFPACH